MIFFLLRFNSFLLLFLLCLFSSGCTSIYFEQVVSPAETISYELAKLPQKEYWTGIVFNGNKIGFSHTTINHETDGNWRLDAETVVAFHFMGLEKNRTGST